jgi:hypothetical protein
VKLSVEHITEKLKIEFLSHPIYIQAFYIAVKLIINVKMLVEKQKVQSETERLDME